MNERSRTPEIHGMEGIWGGAPAEATDSPAVLVRRIHRLFRGRYAITILLALVFAAAGGYAGYIATEPQFRSEAKVHIKPMMDRVLFETENNNLMPMFTNYVRTQAEHLRSQRVVSMAMQSDAWKKFGRGLTPQAREDFKRSLRVETDRFGGEWITVSFLDTDANAARIAVEEILHAYEEIHGSTELMSTTGRVNKLREMQRDAESAIKLNQARIQEIASEFGTTDLGVLHQRQLDTIVKLTETRQVLELQIADREAAVNSAGDTPTAEPGDLGVEEIARLDQHMERLLLDRRSIERRIEQLKRSLGERHRDVVAAMAALDTVNAEISRYADDWRRLQIGADPTVPGGGRLTLEQLRERHRIVNQELTRAQAQAIYLNQKRAGVQELNEAIDVRKAELGRIRVRLEALTTENQVESFSEYAGRITFQEASQPFSPSVDNRVKYAGVGGFLAACLPIGLIGLRGLLDGRFRYSDEAGDPSLHIALLGILPALPEKLEDPEEIAVAAHCVHQIRTLLQIGGGEQGRRTFAITSPTAGDGKTSLALSLGISFASTGMRTLLIDLDMIGGGLTSSLRAKSDEGTMDAIEHASLDPYVVETRISRLSILPIGRHDAPRVNALSPAGVRDLLARAKEAFDVVVVDTGPVLGSLEAQLVTGLVDGVVIAVGRGQQRAQTQRALDALARLNARVLGLVFNRAQPGDFKRAVSSASVRSAPVEPRAGDAGPLRGSVLDSIGKLGPLARTVASEVRSEEVATGG